MTSYLRSSSSRACSIGYSACSIERAVAYLPVFNVFVWTGEYDLKTLRVDAYFFENGVKNHLRFQKHPDTCGQGLILTSPIVTLHGRLHT